jgi:hypothetical protein
MDEREAAGQEDSPLGKEKDEHAALQYTCHKMLKASQFTSSP